MNLKSCDLGLRCTVKLHLLSLYSLLLYSLLLWFPFTGQMVAQTAQPVVELDPIELEARATRVLNTYCASCHGTAKQEGQVQLDALETIDAVDRQSLLSKAQEVIHLKEMPPEEAKQPNPGEREILLKWVDHQLTGDASRALAEKLLRFEYGNVVSHRELFSGKHADLKGYTIDRRWLISEFIFQ